MPQKACDGSSWFSRGDLTEPLRIRRLLSAKPGNYVKNGSVLWPHLATLLGRARIQVPF
jgi:hypothetical protein